MEPSPVPDQASVSTQEATPTDLPEPDVYSMRAALLDIFKAGIATFRGIPSDSVSNRNRAQPSNIQSIMIGIIVGPSVLIMNVLVGAASFCAPLALGHITLRYLLPPPYGDAYRAAPIISSVKYATVGGAYMSFTIGALITSTVAICCMAKSKKTSSSGDTESESDAVTYVRRVGPALSAMTTVVSGIMGARMLRRFGWDTEDALDAWYSVGAGALGYVVNKVGWELLMSGWKKMVELRRSTFDAEGGAESRGEKR